MVPVSYYLILGGILFTIGTVGILVRRNALIIFMSIEVMLNAVNLTFLAAGRYLNSLDGQVIVFLVLTVAAAEVAVGLALVLQLQRQFKTLDTEAASKMRG
jgi:NADH-quinone oxidoreductase subunit K